MKRAELPFLFDEVDDEDREKGSHDHLRPLLEADEVVITIRRIRKPRGSK